MGFYVRSSLRQQPTQVDREKWKRTETKTKLKTRKSLVAGTLQKNWEIESYTTLQKTAEQ